MESALAGIKFFCEQQKLNAQFDHNQLSKKFTRMQSQCKAKLEQVHQGYLQAKRRYQETVQEKNGIQADINELAQKYQQKSLQTRKLQEMVKALQQENEDLKRRFACGGGGRSNGSGGGMHTAGGVQLSTSGRHPSRFGSGPMQMHKSVIELSPTPGGGAFLGHGSATVPQQRPGTAAAGFARNMFAPGSISPGALQPALAVQQRPNTSGAGMFGSGGNNRMAGGGVGVGNSMRLMPRGGSLGLASPNGMLSM
uniref:E3 ubiquitin-protein ligase CCNB1IP1 n=1 Tax=Tetradesmus obliquus TaxID=3088 RepID=A0A383WHG9_TETOB|eukprot:jgi/Sobl393_1/8298/SZX76935.1